MNHNGGPEDGSCTLGFTGYIGGNLVGVTAGHCSGDSAEWMPEGNNGPAQPLGTFPRGQKCYNYAPGGCGDYALVDINESIPNLGGVIGKYRINDIVDGVGAGSVVCNPRRAGDHRLGSLTFSPLLYLTEVESETPGPPRGGPGVSLCPVGGLVAGVDVDEPADVLRAGLVLADLVLGT
jgi:hypothetical protein